MSKLKQGDIVLVSFDPTIGHEQAGYRPALVVSNSDFNNASNLVLVCPITNTNRRKPMDILLEGTKTTGYVLCENIRAVDLRNRGYKITGDAVLRETMLRVTEILQGATDVLD